MKKQLYLSCLTAAAIFCLTGCGGRKPAITDTSELAGTWYGCGNALGQDSDFRADNLCLSIDSQGSLTLSDMEQSSDLFCGTISIDSDSTISITEDAFRDNRLPAGWDSFDGEGELSYRAPDTSHLLLTYEDTSYYFEKEDTSVEEKADTSVSPLLDIAETDIWYSSPENAEDDSVYELALYDKYAELYAIQPDNSEPGVFITNLLYCGNEGGEFSFYTFRDDAMELPEIFDSLPDGISEITVRLSASPDSESLTMEYDGKSLSFYNNVIYGLNTSSTAYYLNNTSFRWNFDGSSHFCRFFTDQGTGRLCLSIADAKEEAEADNTICLEVTVDEADKSLLLYFDRSRSKTTADRDSALFQYFKTMEKEHGNPLRIPFTFKDNRLRLKARKYFGKNDTFDLKEENHYVQTQ